MIEVEAPDGTVVEFPDGTSRDVMRQAMARRFGGGAPAPAPVAASLKRPPATQQSVMDSAVGFMANLNRGLGVGDELAGGFNAVADVAAGRSRVDLGGLSASIGALLTNNVNTARELFKLSGGEDALAKGMAKQRGTEDSFAASNPKSAALAKGTGMAATVLIPGQGATQAVGGVSRGAAAARGAVAAALPAYAYGLADRGDLQERVGAANLSAAVAGPLGAVGGVVASRSRRAPVQDLATRRAQVESSLGEMGVNPRALPADATQQMDDLLRANHSPDDVAMAVAARTLPTPVPLRTGQLTNDPTQQLTENLALRGANGPQAAMIMRGSEGMQQDALRANVGQIADNLYGAGPAPVRGQAGEMVSTRLNSSFDQAKAGVDDAYALAREAGEGTTLPRSEVPAFAGRLREAVRDFDPQRVPAVSRALSRLDDVGSATQVRDIFDVRSQLTALRGSSDAVEATAAGRAVRELDAAMDDAVTRDLFSGDPTSVTAWREAIGQRRRFGQLFEGDDLLNKLTERTSRGGERTLRVDPVDATNYIFGRSEMGFVGRQNLSRDLGRLRTVLGPQSTEWGAIRTEAFQRLAQSGEGAYEGGARQFSGVKFAKAWEDFGRRDPRLRQLLFTDPEVSQISQFARVASRATSPVRGGDNNSNTATALKHLVMNMKFLRGVPMLREIVEGAEAQAATNAAQRSVSGALPVRAAPRAAGRGLLVGEAQAIGAGSSASVSPK